MKVKIGQEIISDKEYKIESISGRQISVKVGDKAVVRGDGFIEYTTGEAKGVMSNVFSFDLEMEGYDYQNISKLILKRLDCVFGLENFLREEDIEYKEFLDEIEDVLSDIL